MAVLAMVLLVSRLQPEVDIMNVAAEQTSAAATSRRTTRSGAEAIVEALRACKVELVIGYSGGGTGALIHQVATAGI
jgi:hypothetical protein